MTGDTRLSPRWCRLTAAIPLSLSWTKRLCASCRMIA
jgi:hypothetical protein